MQSCWGKFQSKFPQWQWLLLFLYQWGKLDLANVWSGTFNTPQSNQPHLNGIQMWHYEHSQRRPLTSAFPLVKFEGCANQITSKRTGRQSKNNLSYQDCKPGSSSDRRDTHTLPACPFPCTFWGDTPGTFSSCTCPFHSSPHSCICTQHSWLYSAWRNLVRKQDTTLSLKQLPMMLKTELTT